MDQAVAAVDAAYVSLRPPGWSGYWPRGTDWRERADFRGQTVIWRQDEAGNLWADQEDAHEADFYTLRTDPTDGPFPYAELRALLAAAATTLRGSAT